MIISAFLRCRTEQRFCRVSIFTQVPAVLSGTLQENAAENTAITARPAVRQKKKSRLLQAVSAALRSWLCRCFRATFMRQQFLPECSGRKILIYPLFLCVTAGCISRCRSGAILFVKVLKHFYSAPVILCLCLQKIYGKPINQNRAEPEKSESFSGHAMSKTPALQIWQKCWDFLSPEQFIFCKRCC